METNMAYSDNNLFFEAHEAIKAGAQPFADIAIPAVGAECSIV